MKKRDNELADRRQVAADAKKALLENYRASQTPELAAKLAERAAIAAARAEAEQREAAGKAMIARVVEDEAARKAERDRRYAARKARRG